MKRIKFLLVALVLVLTLSACRVEPEEIPFDPEAVEVKLLKNGKELSEQELVENQIEGHITTINLSVSDNLPEDITPKIVWTRNLIPLVEGREYSYTPVQGLLSKTDIFATLSFTYEDKEYSIQTETFTVKVLGRQATIVIDTIHPDLNEAIVNYIIKENATKIDFNASVAGDYSVSDLVWWAVDEETLQQTKIGQGVANISYTPTSSGVVRIEARIEGDKFISNKIYINTSYGALSLSSQVDEHNQMEIMSSFSNPLLEGTYSWEALTQSGQDYEVYSVENKNNITVDLNALTEPMLVRAIFTPNNDPTPIVSDPIVVSSNSVVVTNEAELLQALQDKAKAIKLGADILYTEIDSTSARKPIKITYPVLITGKKDDGGYYKLSSLGIFTFIQVSSNNVWFKDLKIDHSSRYNVVVSSSVNGYFENVEFIRPGGGSDMLTPGAGIYAHGSYVTVKNITITQGFNSGFRVEAIYRDGELLRKANITILGRFDYVSDELVAPVVSVTSKSADANITAIGFDEFVIPIGGGKMIRRWSNDAYGVKWQLQEPYNVTYHPGDPVDFSGITINVRIGANESTTFGLDFVYLFLDLFKETGMIRITKRGQVNVPIFEYIIYSYDESIGGDYLKYRDKNGNDVLPLLPTELDYYEVHIWVGDTTEGDGLYLGYIVVEVIPEDAEPTS